MTDRRALAQIRAVLDAPAPDPRTQLDAIDRIVADRLDDPVALVTAHAATHPRPPGSPPHYLRCDAMKDGMRCLMGDQHAGQHQFEE